MIALLPGLLLALFAAWSGTFAGGASASGAASAHLALLAALAARPPALGDALRLGRSGRWLPAALAVAVAASWWTSPVPRAGLVGVALLPAFFLLPGWVAGCWRGDGRRRGVAAVAAVVSAVAVGSLIDLAASGAGRAAMPLGHHNLLAAWLVILVPLAAVGARRSGRWRWGSVAALVVAVAAVVASRSLLGALALAAQALLAAAASRRRGPRLAALGGAVALLVLAAPRLIGIAGGADPSARARAVYAEAGLAGLAERPALGWGPGATPWTVGAYVRPVPGVNPSSEEVAQLHSLPLALAYELGIPGALLAAGLLAAFALRRWREARGGEDPALVRAGLLGLLGGGVAALGNAWLDVAALPLALALAAGAALAGGAPRVGGPAPAAARGSRWPVRVYAVAVLAFLAPRDLATFHYEAARRAASVAAVRAALARAVELDAAFPLYRARWAQYGGEGEAESIPAAAEALAAARAAPGVAALWLSAGALAADAGAPWAEPALVHAQRLDPLGGLAPFYRLVARPTAPGAAGCGARALLGEPRLAAATFWQGRAGLLAQVRGELAAWPGVDRGWLAAMTAALPPTGARAGGAVRQLAVWGETGASSVSLHAFRRRPWGAEWFAVPVFGDRLRAADLPAASALPSSSVGAFPPTACAP